MRIKSIAAAVTATAFMGALLASPAAAQNQQEGLVNVAIEDVIVQVPISVAANICDVNVAVLAEIDDEAEACVATADAAARRGPGSGGGLIVDIPIDVSLLDNNTATDGGPTNLVSPGTIVDPLPAGLTALL
jgi:hypothetical protein